MILDRREGSHFGRRRENRAASAQAVFLGNGDCLPIPLGIGSYRGGSSHKRISSDELESYNSTFHLVALHSRYLPSPKPQHMVGT